MVVLITLTVYGADVGPTFDLYSDFDGYAVPFEFGVARVDLIAGYTSTLVPDGANIIRVQSIGTCPNYYDVSISGVPSSSPSESISSSISESVSSSISASISPSSSVSPSSSPSASISFSEGPSIVGLRLTTQKTGGCGDPTTLPIENYIYIEYDSSLFVLGGDSKYNVITSGPPIATVVDVYDSTEMDISARSPITDVNTVSATEPTHAGSYVLYYGDTSDEAATAYLTVAWNAGNGRLEANLEVCP